MRKVLDFRVPPYPCQISVLHTVNAGVGNLHRMDIVLLACLGNGIIDFYPLHHL